MRNYSSIITVVVSLLLFGNVSLAKAPLNLSIAKKDVVAYYNSGQYSYDITKALEPAQAYLARRIAENNASKNKRKLALVLDIDETAISNYAAMRKNDFGATPANIKAQENATNHPAIKRVLALYKYAKKHGVTVFFITGRGENQRKTTTEELHNAGYSTWAHLYLCDTTTTHCTEKNFKPLTRKKIVALGYDIVLNVGDQYSDLNGGYADYVAKLPDPFYFVP